MPEQMLTTKVPPLHERVKARSTIGKENSRPNSPAAAHPVPPKRLVGNPGGAGDGAKLRVPSPPSNSVIDSAQRIHPLGLVLEPPSLIVRLRCRAQWDDGGPQ